MKKRDLISSLLVIFLYLFFSSSPVIAKQNFEFYYQTIVDVEDIRATGGTATRDAYDKTGDQRWNSKTDPNIVYTVRRIKINSRQELIDAIGVPEWKMTTGQKAMLKAYDTASSEAIEERSKYSYRDPIEVLLSDNSNADWSYTARPGPKIFGTTIFAYILFFSINIGVRPISIRII